MPKPNPPMTALGFDFGMRRIGVAIGQTITGIARPLTVLAAIDGVPQWDAIEQLISTWKADALIVGLPYNTDGTEQEITLAARKFSRKLQARFQLPVHLIDERYSTKEAKIDPVFQATKKANIDSYAAAVILDAWLRQQPPAK